MPASTSVSDVPFPTTAAGAAAVVVDGSAASSSTALSTVTPGPLALAALWAQTQAWAAELGFSQIGVSDVDLREAEPGLLAWLAAGCHGGMDYMAAHGLKRARPAELLPGTLRVITARMDYLPRVLTSAAVPPGPPPDWRREEHQRLNDPEAAVVSVYARGRDYHKVLRQRLVQLVSRMETVVGPMGARVFCDSAPVLEVALATRSGLGWRGKHTLALSREAGSMFFLGDIFINLPLPVTPAAAAHCGSCTACIDACPTGAITAPGQVDARRCISYLTIEHDGPIPLDLRPLIGNHVYGCDDCQVVCPWNKFAQRASLPDFDVRHGLDSATWQDLWSWTEPQFLQRTEGSPIRRIGYTRWRRNLVVVGGNALRADPGTGRRASLVAALQAELHLAAPANDWIREHLQWALSQAPSISAT